MWMICGWYLDDMWMIFGWYLDDIWMISGWYVADIWTICGWYLDNIWMKCGWYVDDIWMICGWYMDDIWMKCFHPDSVRTGIQIVEFSSSVCTQISPGWWLEFKSGVKVEFKWSFEVEFRTTSWHLVVTSTSVFLVRVLMRIGQSFEITLYSLNNVLFSNINY